MLYPLSYEGQPREGQDDTLPTIDPLRAGDP